MGGGTVWRSSSVLLVAMALAGCQNTDLAAGSLRSDFFVARNAATPDVVAASSMMPTGADTEAPSGFVAFCSRNSDQCREAPNTEAVVRLDEKLWKTLWDVNTAWNTTVKPMEDAAHYGRVDYWTIPTDGYGDCEDYALGKRKSLVAKGLPSQALRIAMAQLPDGEAHAVLTVTTDRGDYVLDNLNPAVLPWNATGYVWIARQMPDELKWASVGRGGRDGQAIVTANIAP